MKTFTSSMRGAALWMPAMAWAHPGNHGASFMHDAALPDIGLAGLALVLVIAGVLGARRAYVVYRQRAVASADVRADERRHH